MSTLAQHLGSTLSACIPPLTCCASKHVCACVLTRVSMQVGSQVMVLIGIQDPTLGAALSDLLRNQPTVLALASSPELSKITRLGGRQLRGEPRGIAALLSGLLPGDAAARADAQVTDCGSGGAHNKRWLWRACRGLGRGLAVAGVRDVVETPKEGFVMCTVIQAGVRDVVETPKEGRSL